MSEVQVVLGRGRWGQLAPALIRAQTDGEFTLDSVFVACNRIEDQAEDLSGLPTAWQRTLRTELDAANAPSMSVGDEVYFWSDTCMLIGVWRCAATGWEKLEPTFSEWDAAAG
ncbi:MAG: hypothetical protein WCH93_12360 [Actinomycetota bacterium]